jgi:hypothetical protein
VSNQRTPPPGRSNDRTLEYDLVAVAVLLAGIGFVELIVLSI